MRWIERVADDGALRTPAFSLDFAHRYARRARGDDRVRRRGIVDVGEQLHFERWALRPVLLNEIGVGQGRRQVGGELQPVRGGPARKPQLGYPVPCTFDVGPQRGLSAWRRV